MRRLRRTALAILMVVAGGPGMAQQPAPPGMPLAEAAARRFPQPIRVGDLVGRRVLQPRESQPTLGRVRAVVRRADGQVEVVMDTGGWLGLFTRPVAVPLEATVWLGPYVEVVDLSPAELARLATFDATGTTVLPPGDVVRIGLARPSH